MTTYRLDPEPTDVDTVWCETSSGEFEKFEKTPSPFTPRTFLWESEHYSYKWSELLNEYVSVSTVNPLNVADLTSFPWRIHDGDKSRIVDHDGAKITKVYTDELTFSDDEKIAAFIVRAVNSYAEGK